MATKEQQAMVIDAINSASEVWIQAFNVGDAAGCVAQYESDAVMHARPFGTFTGTAAILAFWQKLMDDGFSDVEYVDPKIEVIDETCGVLTSNWKMNKAHGVIHKEVWVLQKDGTAKLREDDFEAKG